MNIPKRHSAAGFTLVEMLVVIAIIGILAGLTTVAVMAALGRAKDVRIKAELDSLDMALKDFKNRYGAYPPCDLRIGTGSTTYPNQNALIAFLIQAFPRYLHNGNASLIQSDLSTAGVDTHNFRPDAALVFWLQGLNPDVTQPFLGVPTTKATASVPTFSTTIYSPTPLFNFDQTRLKTVTPSAAAASSGSNVMAQFVYVPVNQTSPYVYFDLNVYGSLTSVSAGNGAYPAYDPSQFTVTNTDSSSGGTATPYVLDVNGNGSLTAPPDTFCNPTSFQIISAGQDNQFGAFGSAFRLYPTGTGYDSSGAEDDNISNFLTNSSNLGDAKPN